MEPKIIFEDDSLFVIDKPAGYITNDADTTTTQPVLQTWVRNNFDYPLKNNLEMRDGIVHRLDKETSGLLIVAKTKDAFEALQKEFKERKVQKTYIALVHGNLEGEGKIEALVGRLPWRRDRFGIIPNGRESETLYKVIKFYDSSKATDMSSIRSHKGENGGHTLVEFTPKTGRTHQIRIHAKHIGHALVADEFYAGRKTARNDRVWCPRLFLHASKIKILNYEFKSDLPEELQNVLTLI